VTEKCRINPWRWQDRLGFSQAWRVAGAESIVFVAGQGSVSAEGELVGESVLEVEAVAVV
jgi:hypothetical protein